MLVKKPTYDLLPNILPRNTKGLLQYNKPVSKNLPYELIGGFTSAYARMSGDPDESHGVASEVIQRPLEVPKQWGRSFKSLNSFQGYFTVTANSNVFLRSGNLSNFTDPGQNSIYLGLETCCNSTQGETKPPSKRSPRDFSPSP